MKTALTFEEVLQSEFYSLVEQIEELLSTQEAQLVEIRSQLIAELKKATGYTYTVYA